MAAYTTLTWANTCAHVRLLYCKPDSTQQQNQRTELLLYTHIYFFLFRLDPALIRPGRVDMKEFVDYCSEHQLTQMFLRFYPEEPESRAGEFARLALSVGKPISAAQVQGFFMMHKTDPDTVLKNIELLPSVWWRLTSRMSFACVCDTDARKCWTHVCVSEACFFSTFFVVILCTRTLNGFNCVIKKKELWCITIQRAFKRSSDLSKETNLGFKAL